MDHEGRVVEFNPAAERDVRLRATRSDRARDGRADRPARRCASAHRRGLARYLAGERAAHAGPAHRDHGACARTAREFPVELTITRIDVPGPPIVHRLPARHHRAQARPRPSCAPRARASSRRPTRRGAASSATCTTARSSGSSALALTLRLRARAARRRPARRVASCSTRRSTELAAATAELRELARGIHPAVLTDGGLAPALAALVAPRAGRRSSWSRRARASGCPAPVEAAGVLRRRRGADERRPLRRGARASRSRSRRVDGAARGRGARRRRAAAPTPSGGTGLRGLADRVAALDGTLDVDSPAGDGTTLRAEIPCAS